MTTFETELDRSAGAIGDHDAGCETPVTVMIDRQRAATPDATAVDGPEHLTYAELTDRADRLAGRLRGLVTEPEPRVGVLLPHSADLLVAVIAVLKSGAAYVPLDPGYPAERLTYIAADSGIDVVIAAAGTRRLVPGTVTTVLDIQDASGTAAPGYEPPHPDRTATVIYTSGSTGRPKGVLIPHRGLANLARAAAGAFGLGPGDRFLMLASASFSAALEELFPPLTRGAAVVFPPDRAALSSVPELLATVGRLRVTHLITQTALWRIMVDHLTDSAARLPECVRMVGMSGERCTARAFARWRPLGIPLLHIYGPTETTATATYGPIIDAAAEPCDEPPIGLPIVNTRLYVTDAEMHPVPDGTTGELYVGGASVARGYLGHPGLTAERFVPDPFSGVPGAVLYRTGDLVTRLPDGRFTFVGRVDDQVKIRGYRVEPAEVQTALERHHLVRQAVVIADEEPDGHRRLIAYVAAPPSVTSQELRDFVSGRLPAYMVPSIVIRLDALPLTAHRKIDKAALPRPDGTRPEQDAAYTPPSGRDEERLCALWAGLLRLDRVGATDDFLALGGDSLLASRLLLHITDAFGVTLTPREVFEAGTVRRLAEVIGTRSPEPEAARAPVEDDVCDPAGARDGATPIAPVQQGMWFLSQLLADSPANNSPWQCRLYGHLEAAALRRAAQELVRRHEVLGAAYPDVDGQATQVAAHDGPEWREADLRAHPDPEAEARRLADEAARRPFDVTTGPLLRFLLLRLADEEHLLVCNVHHLVFDVRSLELTLAELGRLYRDPDRPAAAVPQYADLSVRHQRTRDGAAYERGLQYWTSRLADCVPFRLPVTPPAAKAGAYDGAVYDFWLPDALFHDVRGFAREHGATPYMVLLSAYVAWLYRWSGETDIAVATPMAGRTVPAADDVIGLFIITAILRARVRGERPFTALLDQVRADALEAYAHQDVPLDEVVTRLSAGGGMARDPFRILFALQHDPSAHADWPGIRLGPIDDLPTGTAKFDLSLIFIVRADGVAGRVEYRTSVLDEDQAGRIARDYCDLLRTVLADPGAAIDALRPRPGTALADRKVGESDGRARA